MVNGPPTPGPAPLSEIPGEPSGPAGPEDRPEIEADPGGDFRQHMRRANALVAESQLAEAEGEIVSALEALPDDLRALKLLALVRFRLGRLAEAGDAYRRVTRAAPEDAAARLNLGLIALKLEHFADASHELAAAVALRPQDRRAVGYLAYALARQGQRAAAADAFRRAGQPDLAAQQEAQLAAEQAAADAAARSEEAGEDEAEAEVEDQATPGADLLAPGAEAVAGAGIALASFVLERMISAEPPAPSLTSEAAPTDAGEVSYVAGDVLRLVVDGEATVSGGSLLAAHGELALGPARRRRRGRETDEPLATGEVPFYRCRGRGELWMSSSRSGGSLAAIELEEDVLFLRESLVRGFAGPLVWDSGSVPRTRLQVMHFHGSGRLLLDWGGADVLAVRLTHARRMLVPEGRLLGWLGGVVAHAAAGGDSGATLVACEGEGVLLIARHGEPREPVHQPAQSGHDGPGRADPGDALLHR